MKTLASVLTLLEQFSLYLCFKKLHTGAKYLYREIPNEVYLLLKDYKVNYLEEKKM